MKLRNIMDFKFDRGWKLLIYFDLLLPALLYLLAFITKFPTLAKLFHSYEIFIVNPIPNIKALTGIIGLIYHLGILGYTIKKRNYIDLIICIIITLLVAAFFWFGINYTILKPLTFASF